MFFTTQRYNRTSIIPIPIITLKSVLLYVLFLLKTNRQHKAELCDITRNIIREKLQIKDIKIATPGYGGGWGNYMPSLIRATQRGQFGYSKKRNKMDRERRKGETFYPVLKINTYVFIV